MTDEREFIGFITSEPITAPKTVINGILEMDDTGFWFRGEKIEDAGEAHRAFLEAINRDGTGKDAVQDRLLVWLREIAALDPRKLYAGYDAVRLAQSALKEVGDD